MIKHDEKVKPDLEEISDYKWISIKDLRADIDKNPDKYTKWFKEILKRLAVNNQF